MKLSEHMIVGQSTILIPDLGPHAVGLIMAVEDRLERVGADCVSWYQDSLETGFFRTLAGKQQDALVVTHAQVREYQVLITARPFGTALHVARLVMGVPKLANDLKRAVRLVDDREHRFEVGTELDVLDALQLDAFLSLTKLALQDAIRAFRGTADATTEAHEAAWLE